MNKEKKQSSELMEEARRRAKIQQLMAEKHKIESVRWYELINGKKFPTEKFSDDFKTLIEKAKLRLCPTSTQVPVNAFKDAFTQLIDVDIMQLSYFQFGVLSNSMEYLPFDMTYLTKEQYINIIDEWAAYIDMYQNEADAMRKQAQKDATTELEMKLAALAAKEGIRIEKGANNVINTNTVGEA